jgi:hypothetical protein
MQRPALVQYLWATGAMDCPIDATATQQGWIRCIDDGFRILFRYVSLDQFQNGIVDPNLHLSTPEQDKSLAATVIKQPKSARSRGIPWRSRAIHCR